MTADELADEEWGPVKEKGKKKGKKGKSKGNVDEEEEPLEPMPQTEVHVEAKGPTEVTAEDLADEEWGPVKAKAKGKKGKKEKSKTEEGEKEEEKADESGMSLYFKFMLYRIDDSASSYLKGRRKYS